MEYLIAILGFLLLARILLGTELRGVVVFFVLLAGIQLIARGDPQLAAAITRPLLTIFVLAVGFRFLTKRIFG